MNRGFEAKESQMMETDKSRFDSMNLAQIREGIANSEAEIDRWLRQSILPRLREHISEGIPHLVWVDTSTTVSVPRWAAPWMPSAAKPARTLLAWRYGEAIKDRPYFDKICTVAGCVGWRCRALRGGVNRRTAATIRFDDEGKPVRLKLGPTATPQSAAVATGAALAAVKFMHLIALNTHVSDLDFLGKLLAAAEELKGLGIDPLTLVRPAAEAEA